MTYKISVAMATYNGGAYIREQLDSIFKQTYRIDELIVFDDASTDNTLQIVKQYQMQDDIKVNVYTQEQRVGYIKNFANALKMTCGDIIFLCDQDDRWESDKVARIVELFKTYKDMQCVNSSFQYMDKSGVTIPLNKQGNNYGMCWRDVQEHAVQEITFDEIIMHNISMGCTMAFRSTIKDLYLQHSTFQAAHDWELNFIASLQQGLFFYNRSLMKYRIHEHNTTGNDNFNKQKQINAKERYKNARSLLDYTKSLSVYYTFMDDEQIRYTKDVVKLHEKRLNLLSSGRKSTWLSLLKQYKIYSKVVSKKGMVVDVFYKAH